MRKYSIYFTSLILIFSLSITSCKKDNSDSDDDSNYMTGSLNFELPSYILISQEIELNASGITDLETGITYTWQMTGFSIDSTSGQSIVVTAPSSIGDYTVYLTATHDDYVSKSTTRYVTVLDPSDDENFTGIIKGTDSITDLRDGNKYYYKKIGQLYWFTSNLRWSGAGKPYDSISALNEIFGTLYSWNEATGGIAASGLANGPQGVCPEGWSIPTREDWEDFGSTLAGMPVNFDGAWEGLGSMAATNATLNQNKIWKYSNYNLKTNSIGWNALPGGNSSNYFKSFANLNVFGFWWSASEKDSENGEYRFIHYDSANFPYNHAKKSFFTASVRCVKKAD